MSARYFGLLLCLFLAVAGPTTGSANEEQEEPSMELLEFLGSWETEDGEWLDPEELEELILYEGEAYEAENAL